MTWTEFFRWLSAVSRPKPPPVPVPSNPPRINETPISLPPPLPRSVGITPSLLRTLNTADPEGWAPALAAACARFEINTPKRTALFLANIIQETGGFRILKESLNYSVTSLVQNFGRHRISLEDAQRLGRKPDQNPLTTAEQEALANVLYGGEWGADELGNTQPGDGSRFRGYGLLQATGRHMWEKLRVAFDHASLDEVHYWLLTKKGAALSAAWIWAVEKKCNPLADFSKVAEARKAINGGYTGLQEISESYARILKLLEKP